MNPEIELVRQRLMRSEAPMALTGAGVSAESGVPTFRGRDGLWRNFRPVDLATPEAFRKDPALVWQWYDWRRQKVSLASPNAAHRALAEMERRCGNFTLITQNVDGLHGLAGSLRAVELHGSIWRLRCLRCGNAGEDRTMPVSNVPRCPCGGILRPDVVWFGEALPGAALDSAFDAAARADMMMAIGTSGAVEPAASIARRARAAGAFMVEINTGETNLSGIMDVRLEGKAAEILPLLL